METMISIGILMLCVLYLIIKHAVKSGVKEALEELQTDRQESGKNI